ncbi:MAG: hypothetical protein PHU25_22045 [Deltaproteobacteria bacterium]|nr:hypothetical protein [Deltaproteobacteria bacterium]
MQDPIETEKRVRFRRHSDRRVALLLALHEILFDVSPGPARDARLLEAIVRDFETDRAVLLGPLVAGGQGLAVRASAGVPSGEEPVPKGEGVRLVTDLHLGAPGAVTLNRGKRPALFPPEAWDALWSRELGCESQALMGVVVKGERAPATLLLVLQVTCSREWGIRDRDLIEEIGVLLGRAADRALAV